MNLSLVLKALENSHRRQLLIWLKDRRLHFPPPLAEHRDLPGVCASYIFEKSQLSQPTVSQYLQVLQRAGLVKSKRHGRWTFFSRDEKGIKEASRLIGKALAGDQTG
jgi:DNA-binding transcriptional ArsR family regulator